MSFHAHPDDEALLTAGTLARVTAEGHRAVIVVATSGAAGLAAANLTGTDLAERRLAELRRSAAVLGCARVECLGYDDSGMARAPAKAANAFAHADREEAAQRLARILREERADVLTIYDPAGGYGHPDHIRVHDVGVLAAQLAGTPVVLEATLDRRLLLRALRLVCFLPGVPRDFAPARFASAYTAPERLTHRVDVRRFSCLKRAAMAAHVSQAGGGSGLRTLAFLLRLPGPVFRWVLGHEWYVEHGRVAARPLLDDIFASLPRPS
ncbi:PIG-L family deacetylase [Actinomadura barringtoniae]|uniref:PIG-L family deacetylase n=1 Tax=Actinomadura barringtoniae TaxID=1427535 RepID=A0A939PQ91_9ACTN|nr:PIG-L family deacetylase [Actinomadura barringtoniae]